MRRYLAILALLLLTTMPAAAGGLKLYGTYRWMHAVSDTAVAGSTIEADDEWAWGGGADIRFASWGSFELDYMTAELNLTAAGQSLGVADTDIYGGSLNLHLFSDEAQDLYVGFGGYYTELDEFVARSGAVVEIEDELTIGLRAGLDLAITKRVWATFGARYLDLEMRNQLNSVEIDPLTLSAGLAVRFGD